MSESNVKPLALKRARLVFLLLKFERAAGPLIKSTPELLEGADERWYHVVPGSRRFDSPPGWFVKREHLGDVIAWAIGDLQIFLPNLKEELTREPSTHDA